jgi:hypothetical protein
MLGSLFRATIGVAAAAVLSISVGSVPSRANVIGIESYMGHADLAYSGDLQIQGKTGTIQGKVYRAPGLQRTDFSVSGVSFGSLVDLAKGLGVLWSSAYRSYATTPLDQYGVRDWVPQLQNHSQVSIVPSTGEGTLHEVNGVMTQRYELAGVSPEGTPYTGQLWATAEGVIVRLVARIATVDGPITYNLTNLRLGAQAPSLFAVPAGSQQRSGVEAAGLLGF